MKKVLIISAVFPPEPVVSAKLSFSLAKAITELKLADVTVISPRPTRPYGFKFDTEKPLTPFEHIQVNSFTYPESRLIGRLKETYSFGKACYEYIVAHHQEISCIYSSTWPLFAQYYTIKAAKKFNIPVVIHIQDIYPESLSNKLPFAKPVFDALLLPLDRFAFKYANKIIAISEKMRAYLAKTRKVDMDKIAVIQNWQDEDDFISYHNQATVKENEQGPFTFMYLGNIGPVAGVDVLIDAFNEANLVNSRLVIAGDGSAKDMLQKKAVALNRKDIEFWPVSDGAVQQVQARANIMLLPMKKGSASSSVPSKFPAYMLSKKPVLACVDAGSEISEVIEKTNCGWVVEPENIAELAQKMQQLILLTDTELYDMGNNGFKYAMAHFSKAENLKKLLNIVINAIPK